jgi:hypothetical protein
MNRLSPMITRLPAPMSASRSRASLAAVAEDGFHRDAVRHVHHRAGFGDRAFAGSSSTSTNCISLPTILKSISCARRRARRDRRGSPEPR